MPKDGLTRAERQIAFAERPTRPCDCGDLKRRYTAKNSKGQLKTTWRCNACQRKRKAEARRAMGIPERNWIAEGRNKMEKWPPLEEIIQRRIGLQYIIGRIDPRVLEPSRGPRGFFSRP